MKICLVMGTRPNFMKIASLIDPLSRTDINFFIVHTGQHYDKNMSSDIIKSLFPVEIDYLIKSNIEGEINQFSHIMVEFEKICDFEKPDIVVVPGDVNSTLACSLVASKKNIKIAHLEAGLRSFDRDMPEEINRILTDHLSDILFTTEKSAKINLFKEGIKKEKIIFVGNTMIDSLKKTIDKAIKNKFYEKYRLSSNNYCLLTIHRPSNVDDIDRLKEIIDMINTISKTIKVVFPIHPRTLNSIKLNNININDEIIDIEPLPYLEFLGLMAESKVVITDSGGIQEETTYLGIQCLTIRDNTERPITIEIGTNKLLGSDFEKVKKEVLEITKGKLKKGRIPKYWDGRAGERIVEFLKKHF